MGQGSACKDLSSACVIGGKKMTLNRRLTSWKEGIQWMGDLEVENSFLHVKFIDFCSDLDYFCLLLLGLDCSSFFQSLQMDSCYLFEIPLFFYVGI